MCKIEEKNFEPEKFFRNIEILSDQTNIYSHTMALSYIIQCIKHNSKKEESTLHILLDTAIELCEKIYKAADHTAKFIAPAYNIKETIMRIAKQKKSL